MSEAYKPSEEETRAAENKMSFRESALSEQRDEALGKMISNEDDRKIIEEMGLSIDSYLHSMKGTIKGHTVDIKHDGHQFVGTLDNVELTAEEAKKIYEKYEKFQNVPEANGIETAAISIRADRLKKIAALEDIL